MSVDEQTFDGEEKKSADKFLSLRIKNTCSPGNEKRSGIIIISIS